MNPLRKAALTLLVSLIYGIPFGGDLFWWTWFTAAIPYIVWTGALLPRWLPPPSSYIEGGEARKGGERG